MIQQLISDIQSVVGSNVSGSGFITCTCPICHSKSKGGFKFENDTIVYNCFKAKCDSTCSISDNEPVYPKFKALMDTMGIDIPLELRIKSKGKTNKVKETINEKLYTYHKYESVKLPDDFIDYDPEYYWWFANLLEERKITFHTELYIGQEGEWKNLLIVPCRYNGRLIGWQGIGHYNGNTWYKNSSHSALMFINNKDGIIKDNPIIVEGIMDAGSYKDIIAVFGNKVTKKQAYFLRNKSPILLPDRTGSNFDETSKKYKWMMCIPSWKEKDINETIIKHGMFVTMKRIHDGLVDYSTKSVAKFKMWNRKRRTK